MFRHPMMFVTGGISGPEGTKLNPVTDRFHETTQTLVDNGTYDRAHIRLLKPIKVVAILDDAYMHFVLSNKGASGQPEEHLEDFRGKGIFNIEAMKTMVAGDLSWEDVFGFSLPVDLFQKDTTAEELLPYVHTYCQSERLISQHNASLVKINPIFVGRDFQIEEDLCLVLMPYGQNDHLQDAYRDHIKPTVESFHLRCIRADDIYEPVPIVETIWKNINQSTLVVAELTGRNPNVFYELGIAHTVGKDIILLVQTMDDVPFDLRHLRVILYEFTPRGVKELEQKLATMLSTVLARRNSRV